MQIAVTNTYFYFNKILYKQTEGLSMGNPLAPTLANIFLSHMETSLLSNCPEEFKPVFYRRYLDDTFVVFKKESDRTDFFQYINNIHANIKFTMECEDNCKLPFLDILVHRSENSLTTSIYRKPTFTGLGTSFFQLQSYSL